MDVTAALANAGDLTGHSVRSQLAMVGLKAALQQQQVVAQVVTDAAQAARATGAAGAGDGRGSLLDIRV